MTELIAARDNKDIIKIIAMYTEHVGEAPLDLFDGDYDKMTILLKYQAAIYFAFIMIQRLK